MNKRKDAVLYLIPVPIGDAPCNRSLPEFNCGIILSLRYFVVENIRTARRFLKKLVPSIDINELNFAELNEHTHTETISDLLTPMKNGHSIGIMSEAGCPAVADPGCDLVAIAQHKGYQVIPLVGPSSILMALMASGFNGQHFAFHGYLPVEASKRTERIKQLEARLYAENETQIFIETPYRNNKLLTDFIQICKPQTHLCIASNITCTDESIRSLPVKEWANIKYDFNKKPTIFLLGKI